MTIHHEPLYGIAYADADTPIDDLGTVTQEAADTIAAALARGGIAPPDATTQAQLAARITALESRNATATWQKARSTNTTSWPLPVPWTTVPGCTASVVVPAGRQLDVVGTVPMLQAAANSNPALRLTANGTQIEDALVQWSTGTVGIFGPGQVRGEYTAPATPASTTVAIALQGSSPQAGPAAAASSPALVALRWRLL